MTREIHPTVRAGVRAMIRRRAQNVLALLDEQGMPDMLVADAASLVGKAAELLDPYRLAERRAQDADVHGRGTFGVCVELGCSLSALGTDEMYAECCAQHATERRAEMSEEDSDVEPS